MDMDSVVAVKRKFNKYLKKSTVSAIGYAIGHVGLIFERVGAGLIDQVDASCTL